MGRSAQRVDEADHGQRIVTTETTPQLQRPKSEYELHAIDRSTWRVVASAQVCRCGADTRSEANQMLRRAAWYRGMLGVGAGSILSIMAGCGGGDPGNGADVGDMASQPGAADMAGPGGSGNGANAGDMASQPGAADMASQPGAADMAGPGGSGGVHPDWVSGSRLKARVQTAPDGAKAFIGWYDSMLAVNCSFTLAADGVSRCLPSSVPMTGTYWGDLAYVPDAGVGGCSIPLGSSQGTCAASYVTSSVNAGTCSAVAGTPTEMRTHVFQVGPEFVSTLFAVTQPPYLICSAGSKPPGIKLYTLGSEIPASDFAAGNIQIEN
jgi:hypothetical protein